MHHRWDDIAFFHWRYEPERVQRLLPPGLEVDTYDGAAWVTLVPFVLSVRRVGTPWLPWLSRFPETNVRTYVRTRDGRPGIWFLSLDAARLGAVVVGRRYGLPYTWARMKAGGVGPVRWYEAARRWPRPLGSMRAVLEVGAPLGQDELEPLDHFLTARWALFVRRGKDLGVTLVEHAPWPLHRATILHVHDTLIEAAGLPAPHGEPYVHASPGVAARVGRWERSVYVRRGVPTAVATRNEQPIRARTRKGSE